MKYDYVDIIGLLGSLILSITFIPQTYHVYKNKDSVSINKTFLYLIILCSALLSYYSICKKVLPMAIANISVFLNNSAIIIIKRNI